MDGSSNFLGSGTDLMLIGLEGDVITLLFEFSAINNETEYEALIVGLKFAKEVRVCHFSL